MQTTWKPILQIAFTYIGTVVGAGFASGKEIVEFFVQYGTRGLLGILLAAFLFIWAGVRVMIIAYRIRAESYQDISTYLFGKTVGTVFNMVLLTVLFGTTSVMLAATGAIFMESFHLSPQIGIWLSMMAIFVVAKRGLLGIHSVNGLFVPMLILFTFLVFLYTQSWETGEVVVETVRPWVWLSSPLYYVALNVSLTQAVLVPIGRQSRSERPLIWGGLLGGAGIGLLLFLAYCSLSTRMPEILEAEMPMISLLHGLGIGIPTLFALLVYGEIFSTLVANVFGLAEQLKQLTRFRPPVILCGILSVCYLISFVGFGSLLRLLYPLFGQFVVLFLFMLLYRQLRNRTV
ncbi:hypothetical protein [Brevibacillus sp. H7]|uniref:YkvI family membrane protein n=1 Tax=Brevibacillus sp. H7 TaxID=3349138 RepID=UPI0037F95D3D